MAKEVTWEQRGEGRRGRQLVGKGGVGGIKEQRMGENILKIKYPQVRSLYINLWGPNKKLQLNESVTKADGE